VEFATAHPEIGIALCIFLVQRFQGVMSLRTELSSYLQCAVLLTETFQLFAVRSTVDWNFPAISSAQYC
jgi:hypothetical protein